MDLSLLNLDEVLPHRRRMRLVSGILSVEPEGGVFLVDVHGASPFLDAAGAFKPSWVVELVAQAVACHCGWSWRGRDDKPGTFGYVVAVDACEARPAPGLRSGETLRVRVRKEFEMPPAGVYSGSVLGGDARTGSEIEIGQARIKIFVESKLGIMGEERHGAQEGSRHGR